MPSFKEHLQISKKIWILENPQIGLACVIGSFLIKQHKRQQICEKITSSVTKKKKNAKGSVRIQLGKQKPLLAFPVGRDLEQEVRCWRNIWKSLEAGNWRRASASSLVFHQGIWKLLLPPGLDQQGSTEGSELPAAKRPPPSYSPLPQRPLQSSGSAKATPLPPTSGRRIMASALGHLPALACGPHHDRG